MEERKLIVDYKKDPKLRKMYYDFIDTVFPSADFREWYNKGFWADEFIPFSLLENGKIISNVCISKMKLLIEGKETNGIQIGAVGTIPEYRNKGLSRYLMDLILDKYENFADLFFLFANETVTDFYPKFGFKQYNEVVYRSESDIPVSNYSARKLNISDQSDFAILNHYYVECF
jgi:predicted acetyltransferase